jgi:hypothetical protein
MWSDESHVLPSKPVRVPAGSSDWLVGALSCGRLRQPATARDLRHAAPLQLAQRSELFDKFAVVIRATVKGNLVKVPVAHYFLLSGAIWQGVALVAWGVLVIGLVDNLLRPLLVGKDTRLPDYLVLTATLGGMAVFGINGLVLGPAIAAMFVAVRHIYGSTRTALPPGNVTQPSNRAGILKPHSCESRSSDRHA